MFCNNKKLSILFLFILFGYNSSNAQQIPDLDNYKLNTIYQKGCHNCYDLKYSSSIYDALKYVNAIEIDFYDSKNILNKKGALPNHWYVRHEGSSKTGNHNCCYSSILGQNDLDSCLQDVANYCKSNPGHKLITVYLDKKQSWSAGRLPSNLDSLILKYFSKENIFKPADLEKGYASLKIAANNEMWPKYGDLSGKLMFVLTGGNLLHPNKTMSQYVKAQGDNGIIFVAPGIKKAKEIMKQPKGFDELTGKYVVFYNFNHKQVNLGLLTQKLHYISRVYNIEDSCCYKMVSKYINYIAVFKFANPYLLDGHQ